MCMIYNIVEALQPTKLFVSVHEAYVFDTVAIGASRGSREDRKSERPKVRKNSFHNRIAFSDFRFVTTGSRLATPYSVRSDFIPNHIPGYTGSLRSE